MEKFKKIILGTVATVGLAVGIEKGIESKKSVDDRTPLEMLQEGNKKMDSTLNKINQVDSIYRNQVEKMK